MTRNDIQNIFNNLAADAQSTETPQPQYNWWADTVAKADAFLAEQDAN